MSKKREWPTPKYKPGEEVEYRNYRGDQVKAKIVKVTLLPRGDVSYGLSNGAVLSEGAISRSKNI